MQTNRALLITRPNHDLATKYLFAWSEEVIKVAQEKVIPFYDLRGAKAHKDEFESYYKNHKPSFVFLNGHGNTREIAGHDNRSLVDSESNLKGAIIYARSCDAGRWLGHELVKKGTRSFIGYQRKFTFLYSLDKISRPKEDDIAQIFLGPSNLVASTLLKGHSAGAADGRAKDAMYKNFRKLLASTATHEERYAAKLLWSNLKNQVLLGSAAAVI